MGSSLGGSYGSDTNAILVEQKHVIKDSVDPAKNITFLRRAIALALEAERQGNLPVGAVIVLDGKIVGEAGNSLLMPQYNPARHAEIEALRSVPLDLWTRCREMTCYTTLEPCTMCFGTMLLHGIGRIEFGARDEEGGASAMLAHLPPYYSGGAHVPEMIGPILSEECDVLFERVKARFDRLPCGRDHLAAT